MIKNFLYNSGYQILMIIIPIITNPYLARTLGTKAIGINSYTNSVILLFSVFGLLGLTSYSNREIAYSNAKGKKELSKTFISLCCMRAILLCICLVVYFGMMYVSEYRFYFGLQLFSLFYYFVDVSWFFIGIENMKIVVIRNSIVKIISTVLVFLLVRDNGDLGTYIVINGGGMFAGACVVIPQLKKYVQWEPIGRKDITKHILPVLKLFLPQAATSMYVLFDKTMIKWFTDDVKAVGFYDQSQSLAKVPLVLASSLSTAMLPRISNEFSKRNMEKVREYIEVAFKVVSNLAYPAMLGMIGISSTLIHWYLGEKYLQCIPLLRILSITILPIYFTYVTGMMYLTSVNKTKELTVSYIAAALLNLIMNTLLIPKFGAYGAAVGTCMAEFTVLLIQYSYMKKNMGNMNLLRKSWKSIVSAIAMFFFVYLTGEKISQGILATLLQCIVGIGVYAVCMCLLRAEVLQDIRYMVRKILQKKEV